MGFENFYTHMAAGSMPARLSNQAPDTLRYVNPFKDLQKLIIYFWKIIAIQTGEPWKVAETMTCLLEPLQIRVPANFGLKNLDAPFHSNITLTLQDGGSYRANSVILSYNSAVFERLFLELNQTVLDVDDFSPDAVCRSTGMQSELFPSPVQILET